MNMEEINKLYEGFTTCYGPFDRKGDVRKHVILYNNVTFKRKTISFSKLLLELKIGRRLVGDETCDHIDDNALNDNPDNLQVLTREENASKSCARTAKLVTCYCGKEFMQARKETLSCSRVCGQQKRRR